VNLEQKGFEAVLPNAVLFYGPSGTGKTTIGKAVAEESGSRFIKMPLLLNNKAVVAKLIEKAELAEKNFKTDKRRTLIQINEFETLASKESGLTDKLKDFMKDCSKKYHCTLLLTTNNPSLIDQSLLTEDICPVKIPMGPANKEDTKAILQYYLNDKDIKDIDYDVLTNAIMKVQPNQAYSNSQIKKMAEDYIELNKGKTLTQQGLLCYINKKVPQLSKADLEKFKAAERKYSN